VLAATTWPILWTSHPGYRCHGLLDAQGTCIVVSVHRCVMCVSGTEHSLSLNTALASSVLRYSFQQFEFLSAMRLPLDKMKPKFSSPTFF
jgi:hypothetical protein